MSLAVLLKHGKISETKQRCNALIPPQHKGTRCVACSGEQCKCPCAGCGAPDPKPKKAKDADSLEDPVTVARSGRSEDVIWANWNWQTLLRELTHETRFRQCIKHLCDLCLLGQSSSPKDHPLPVVGWDEPLDTEFKIRLAMVRPREGEPDQELPPTAKLRSGYTMADVQLIVNRTLKAKAFSRAHTVFQHWKKLLRPLAEPEVARLIACLTSQTLGTTPVPIISPDAVRSIIKQTAHAIRGKSGTAIISLCRAVQRGVPVYPGNIGAKITERDLHRVTTVLCPQDGIATVKQWLSVCHFCKTRPAQITYKPCGHAIVCKRCLDEDPSLCQHVCQACGTAVDSHTLRERVIASRTFLRLQTNLCSRLHSVWAEHRVPQVTDVSDSYGEHDMDTSL